jgi:seryl-tRNA(Sec) selenium transferase
MKAGKEEIAGLIAAARLFMARDHAAYIAALTARMSSLIARVGDHRGVRADVSAYDYAPRGRLHVDPADAGFDAWALLAALQRGTPRLHLNEAAAWKGTALIDLRGVSPRQDDAVADLISAALRGLAADR